MQLYTLYAEQQIWSQSYKIFPYNDWKKDNEHVVYVYY